MFEWLKSLLGSKKEDIKLSKEVDDEFPKGLISNPPLKKVAGYISGGGGSRTVYMRPEIAAPYLKETSKTSTYDSSEDVARNFLILSTMDSNPSTYSIPDTSSHHCSSYGSGSSYSSSSYDSSSYDSGSCDTSSSSSSSFD